MKVAIVTGASQGIGARIAAGFRRTGYAVVAISRSIRADIVNVTTQLEEQWSFFVKKCVPSTTRSTN